MTDQATILFRPAAPADAEAIAAMFTDEGYPAGPAGRNRIVAWSVMCGWYPARPR